jgi:hypothetical protein
MTVTDADTAATSARVARWYRKGSGDGEENESTVQSGRLRDIVGNPFRPMLVDPSWLTSTVLELTRQMYESRDFSPMPILADALQDAGCDNDDIPNHCRHRVSMCGAVG